MKRDRPSPGSKSRRIDGRPFHVSHYTPIPAVTPADVFLDRLLATPLGKTPSDLLARWRALESTELRAKKPTARYW